MEHVDGYSGEPELKPVSVRVEIVSGLGPMDWDYKIYLNESMEAGGTGRTFLKTAKSAQETLFGLEKEGKL